MPRHHHHRQRVAVCPQTTQQLKAVDVGHANIGQDATAGRFDQSIEETRPGLIECDLEARRAE